MSEDVVEYWAVRLGVAGLWVGPGIGYRVPRPERARMNRSAAYSNAGQWGDDARVVHVRKKPKAPPPLKVGDEVVVRGKVTQLDPGTELDVRVGDVWVSSNLCERVKP